MRICGYFSKTKGVLEQKFGKHSNRRLGGTQSCPGRIPEENSPATTKNRTTMPWAGANSSNTADHSVVYTYTA